jgi:type II secretory pathway component PulM
MNDEQEAELRYEAGMYQSLYENAQARIETLEAALRNCVQYHVKAAADCRAISAVNQGNDLGENSLNHAVDHEIAAEDIGDIARAALAPERSSSDMYEDTFKHLEKDK